MNENSQLLSIVVPAFNEEENIEKLYNELISVLTSLNLNFEIIFVDDGSDDNTWRKIVDLNKKNSRVRGIRFSRNFGHQYAVYAGMIRVSGSVVITMDADLQHPPSLIPQLIEAWRNGAKIVNTIRREHRKTGLCKKLSSKLFYKIFSYFSGIKIVSGMADFRLLDRCVVEQLRQLKEASLFLRGLIQWVGFPSMEIPYDCQQRFAGKSKYSFKKMLRLAVSGIISFSTTPLKLGIWIGFITSLLAFIELIYVFCIKMFLPGRVISGWASITGVISLLFGILFILIGIIGLYIANIAETVRYRPHFIEEETIGFIKSETERNN